MRGRRVRPGIALLEPVVDTWDADVPHGKQGRTVRFEVAQVAEPAVVADDG